MESPIKTHFDILAERYDRNKRRFLQRIYDNAIRSFLRRSVYRWSNVLDVGCGTGAMLQEVSPQFGVGIDISPRMIDIARETRDISHTFHCIDIVNYNTTQVFDYIIMTDVIEHLTEPFATFQKIETLMHHRSKFILTMANPVIEPLLTLMEWFGLKMPEGAHCRMAAWRLEAYLARAGLRIESRGNLLLGTVKYFIIVKEAG